MGSLFGRFLNENGSAQQRCSQLVCETAVLILRELGVGVVGHVRFGIWEGDIITACC